MRLQSIHTEDLMLCSIKGRCLYGEVTELADGRVYLGPVCPGTGWRHATPREIIAYWHKAGSRSALKRGADTELEPRAVAPPRQRLIGVRSL